MKKLSVLAALLLCCSLAFAQGAEADETANSFLIIPRFDYNPIVPLRDGGQKSFSNFGNTSLYTLFEGGIGNSNFSYSVEGHWFSADDPAGLYQNSFRSDETNWLDWAYLTYTAGNFDFSLGKDILAIGTFELDEYDFDSHINLTSTTWNNLAIYQWSAKAGWTTDDESTRLDFQVATSPYGEHPFSSGLYAYSLKWTGEYGPYSSIWSANMMNAGDGDQVFAFASGNKLAFGDAELGLDCLFRGYNGSSLFSQEGTVMGSFSYSFSDKLSLMVKGGWEYCKDSDVIGYVDDEDLLMEDYFVPCSLESMRALRDKDYVFGGLLLTYFPMEDLRLHTAISANTWAEALSVNLGVTYYLDLAKWLKKK